MAAAVTAEADLVCEKHTNAFLVPFWLLARDSWNPVARLVDISVVAAGVGESR
jgi:hypothetical protein